MSRTPANQGEPGLRGSPGPLEMLSVDGTGRALGNGLQEEGGLNRCIQHRLGSSVQGPIGFRPVVKKEGCLHMNFLEILAVCQGLHTFITTRPNGAPRSGLFGEHDHGSLHKSPRRAFLEAPLHSSGAPLVMVSAQPAFAESTACARQTAPGCRHAVTEQRPLRGVDDPSASGSGDLWQGRGRPLSLKRQLSLPNLFIQRTWTHWPTIGPISPDRSDPAGHQANQGVQHTPQGAEAV